MAIKNLVKRTILNVVRWANTNECLEKETGLVANSKPYYGNSLAPACQPDVDISANTPLTLTIHNGNGGRVIMTNSFDRHAKEWVRNMYIIHDDAELDQEISKIISLESLR